ncbi:hypothetical protein HYC85_019854 [Camellia sinensis]|uniref:Signal recognition particle 14 kDa protein n=1 Tax=Camellia sinensis TaxID=4442 RepID=A0A7J7GN59_CAMSI|nr:hypothetical protein HYC85_019854 [Camellia sinensis]
MVLPLRCSLQLKLRHVYEDTHRNSVLLQPDPFLNELTSMFEHSTEKGSVWDLEGFFDFCFCVVSIASMKSKVKRNKMTTAGEEIEYRCLIRATDGKKTISTLVGSKDHQRFQASYGTILKARMTALKKRERKDEKSCTLHLHKKQKASKKQSTASYCCSLTQSPKHSICLDTDDQQQHQQQFEEEKEADGYPEETFQSWANYRKALKQTLARLMDRVLTRSLDSVELEVKARSNNEMKRTLTWWDLMWFGMGAVIGAGIFVLTGLEAKTVAGPAVVLFYVFSGASALLSVFKL